MRWFFANTGLLQRLKKLVGIDWPLLNSPSYTYTHCFLLIGDNFVSDCSRCMVQPFILEVLMSSFERYTSWKITISKEYLPQWEKWGPLLKQKLYIDWIFLFQSKILNTAMIGFHPISLNTFIRNFAQYCNVKKFEYFPKFSK